MPTIGEMLAGAAPKPRQSPLAGVLPAVFSAGDKLKRMASDFAADPVGNIQQRLGFLNDQAGQFNQLHSQATQEAVSSIKGGGNGFGPASQQLAGKLADAYNPMGMVVWHGSPHKFTKFDASKIGTGEGAQAYGHGLYFAESPDVAEVYKKSFIGNSDEWKQVVKRKDRVVDRMLSRYDVSDADTLKSMVANGEPTGVPSMYVNALNRLDEIGSDVSRNAGALYKVDLPDDAIAKMLDWDKPLSQQAPEVQALIKKTKGMLPPNAMDDLGGDLSLLYGPDLTGADFLGTMNSLQPNFGETALQRVGVPGVRYLDGGSRGAGSGTSNFVVFPGNESLLQILERNGVPLK